MPVVFDVKVIVKFDAIKKKLSYNLNPIFKEKTAATFLPAIFPVNLTIFFSYSVFPVYGQWAVILDSPIASFKKSISILNGFKLQSYFSSKQNF